MGLSEEIIAKNLHRVRECIARAAERAARSPEEITIVAVSKTHSADAIRKVYKAGVRHFGENRVQEWEGKYERLKDLKATWHLVGHLQSNKIPRAVRLFHTVDSVDKVDLLRKISSSAKAAGKIRVLLEVRMDRSPQKTGFEREEIAAGIEVGKNLPHIELRGLMCVPPLFFDADQARMSFRALKELRDRLSWQYEIPLPVLSMGMSHDFEVAIEEGATEIRLGTAIFGPRETFQPESDGVESAAKPQP